MDFSLPEDEQMLAEMAADFAGRRLAPEAAESDARGAISPATLRAVAELGLLSVTLPEKAGGAGLPEQAALVVAEALAQGDPAVALAATEHDLGLGALHAAGVDLSSHLVAGAARVAFAQGPDVFVEDEALHGVVAGPRQAAWLVVVAPEGPFLVSADATRPGAALDDAGLTAFGRHTLALDAVPARRAAPSFSARWRLRVGAVAVGLGRAALRSAVDYSQNRKQFGKPINRFQAVQWMLADSATQLDATWLLLRRALVEPSLAEQAAHMAVEAGVFAADAALQIHGGYGYTTEYPVARHFAAANALSLRL